MAKLPIKLSLVANADISSLKTIGQGKELLSERELVGVLRSYNLRNGLIVIGRLSRFISTTKDKHRISGTAYQEPTSRVIITQFGLAYLANMLAVSGANDYKVKEIGDKENLLTLVNVYSNDLIAPGLAEDDEAPTLKQFTSFMVRMYGEQFEFQFNVIDLVARSVLLYKDVVNRVRTDKLESLPDIFKRENGFSIDEYLFYVLMTYAVSEKTATFSKSQLTGADIPTKKESLTDDKIGSFLKMISTDYKTLRELDKEYNSELDPTYTKFRFNPLKLFPVVQTDIGTDCFVIPNTQLFFKRAYGGLYWWFHKYFEDRGAHLDFRAYFGSVFEQYVGDILKSGFGEGNVHPEISYKKGKFIDWWVERDNTVYFFEAKAYQFPLKTKQTGDIELLANEVRTKMVGAIKQVFMRLQDVGKYDELAVFRGKEIVPVVVFWEIPLSSAHVYRELIKEELEVLDKGGLSGIREFEVHFLNIEELEFFCGSAANLSLEKIFADYKNNFSEGFLSIITKMSGEHPKNRHLEKVYDSYMDEMLGKKSAP